MAIYHLTTKIIQRSKGRNAVAAAAYRHATVMFCETEQLYFDYRSKPNVVHTEITIPSLAPLWINELLKTSSDEDRHTPSEILWNKVQQAEKRKDAQLAREVEVALPIELTLEQNILLTREFIQDQLAMRGMIADWSVHWDEGNPHVHILLSMREITNEGFGQKVRTWNSKVILEEIREQWAAYINFYLQKYGHDTRVDHRSYSEQGIALIPTIHEGKAVREMRQRGIETDIMREVSQIKQANIELIKESPDVLLKKIAKEKSIFNLGNVVSELNRYIEEKLYNDGDQDSLQQGALPIVTEKEISTLLSDISKNDTVFSERTLATHVSRHIHNPELFMSALLAVKNSPELIALGAGDDGRDRYTTKSSFALESRLIERTDNLRKNKGLAISKLHLHAGLHEYASQTGKKLSPEQKLVIKHILKTPLVSCVVGRAGTGKSFTLGAAASIYRKAGFNVSGMALSGIAASGLNDHGIKSRTIAGFLLGIEEGAISLTDRDVLIMDEAGMTDAQSMLNVLEIVRESQAKLILVGDPDQLQPVGGGASFRAILERTGFAEITEVRRQQADWQQNATKQLAAGQIKAAFMSYDERGHVHLEPSYNDAHIKLSQDWQNTYHALCQAQSIAADNNISLYSANILKNLLVLAHKNDTVNALNHQLRAIRIQQGHIEQGYSTYNAQNQEMHIAQGERIIFTQNSASLSVENGQFATITNTNISEGGQLLGFDALLDNGKTIAVNCQSYRHFSYGYAATVHKSQGLTRKHSFVMADGYGWNRHLSYVAGSRHQESFNLYATAEIHKTKQHLFRSLSRYGRKDSLIDFPLAFAERRGIGISTISQNLSNKFTRYLSTQYQELKNRIEKLFHPEQYWEKIRKKIEAEDLQIQRENGRLVAAYVDKNREVGQAFGEWQKVLSTHSELSLEDIKTHPTELRKHSSIWQAIESAKKARNEIAFEMMKTPEQYAHVLKICDIPIAQLKWQAKQHLAHSSSPSDIDWRSDAITSEALSLANSKHAPIRQLASLLDLAKRKGASAILQKGLTESLKQLMNNPLYTLEIEEKAPSLYKKGVSLKREKRLSRHH